MGSPRRMLEVEVVVFIPSIAFSAGLLSLAVAAPPREHLFIPLFFQVLVAAPSPPPSGPRDAVIGPWVPL